MLTVLLACCVLGTQAVPIEASLYVSDEVIKVGDPLLVKVRLKNRSNEIVEWRATPSFRTDDVWVEVRSHDMPEFARCNAYTQGDDVGTPRMALAPHSDYCAYDYLVAEYYSDRPYRSNPFLLTQGRYELRGAFRIAGEAGAPIYSDIVEVRIIDRPVEELARIRLANKSLRFGTVNAVDSTISHKYDAELKDLEDNLTASYLRTTLVWQRMLGLCDPTAPEFSLRVEALEGIERIVDPVTSEAIAISLSWQLMSHEEWALALESLENIDELSLAVLIIRLECEARLNRQ